MNDKAIQRKLNQLVRIANELAEESRRRFEHGSLFYESWGRFYIMDDDGDWSGTKRQTHIRFQSDGVCRMGCGSW